LDAAVDLDSDVKSEVEGRIEKLVPPNTLSEAILLAEAAGEVAVPFLKRDPLMKARPAAACVRALALIGSLEAVQAIAEYADEYSFLVLREVVRSADRVDTNSFLQLVAPRLDVTRLPGDAVAHAFRRFGMQGMKSLELAEALTLSGPGAADLSVLQCFPKLRTLELSGPAVTDLNPLRGLVTIRDLTLSSVKVGDFSPLQHLATLERLEIRYTAVDLHQLEGMSTLRSLSIWDGKISNQWALQSFINLQRLTVLGTGLDELEPLKTMASLRSLTLSRFKGSDLSPLRGLTNLESLYLYGSAIGDVAWLDGLTNLESLELIDAKVPDVLALPALPKLRKLGLSGSLKSADQMRGLRRKYPGVRIVG
jgi:Leucine-rich repeat (LRR) protein